MGYLYKLDPAAKSVRLPWSTMAGIHNSSHMTGPKNCGGRVRAKIYIFLDTQKMFIAKEASYKNQILGFAGQIEGFSGPHLAYGPYVVHA
jgi:hypothetical protein